MSAEILVLRVVHVLGGVFWLGSGLFTSFFLMPAFAGSGPAAGAVMAGLQRRRLFTVLPIVAVLTILSGLRLMWIASRGFSPVYFESGMGLTLAVSGALAIVGGVLIFVIGVTKPAPFKEAHTYYAEFADQRPQLVVACLLRPAQVDLAAGHQLDRNAGAVQRGLEVGRARGQLGAADAELQIAKPHLQQRVVRHRTGGLRRVSVAAYRPPHAGLLRRHHQRQPALSAGHEQAPDRPSSSPSVPRTP